MESRAGGLRGLRPGREQGASRRAALGALVAAVLGDDRELPRFGELRALRRVGRGGMGVVFEGEEVSTGRRVAIKLLAREGLKDRARFSREASILRSLEHPRIVRYVAHGEADDGTPYLAMEWLEGADLATVVQERGPLSVEAALSMTLGIAEGVAAAHARGVVHRDLKPSNVLLVGAAPDGAKVIDFGVARDRDEDPRAALTSTGAVLGTPSFMAPEQVRGIHDARTDVYGLGATLFHALSGRAPFEGTHPGAVLLAVAAEAPPSLRVMHPEVPLAVDALVGRLLAKDPRDRPADMRAVAAELSDLLSRPARRPAPLSRVERPPPPLRPTASADVALVGRDRELAWVTSVVDECRREELPALVVVSGEAGTGKTKLLDVLVSNLTAQHPDAHVLVSFGARAHGGGPLEVLEELVACGRRAGLSEALEAVRASLDDVAAAPWPADPRVRVDQLRLAWADLTAAWARPLLVFVVDDADEADLVSLRYVERALASAGASVCVVVASRSPRAWTSMREAVPPSRFFEITLGPLSPRAGFLLACSVAPATEDGELQAVVRRSGGHPLRLKELARLSLVSGRSVSSASLANLAWERLERLTPDLRRVARAAGIAGLRFRVEALATLLEDEPSSIARAVDRLLTEGIFVRGSGEGELAFDGELVALAAHELSTEDDLRRGHAAMARWLASAGRGGPLAVARHLEAAGLDDEARGHFLRAARSALAGDDPSIVDECLERARGGRLDAEVDALAAEAALWRGDLVTAEAAAARAMASSSPGDLLWFLAASLAITVAGQGGQLARTLALASEVAKLPAPDPPRRDARLVAIGRAITQIELQAASTTPTDLSAHLPDTMKGLGPEARAWACRARATRTPDPSFEAIDWLVAAHRAHVEAGDHRSAMQVALYLASYYVWSGAWDLARERIDECRRTSVRLGAGYLEVWTSYTEGKLLAESGGPEARRLLAEVARRARGSPRIAAGAMLYEALAAHRQGDLASAVELARAARTAHVTKAIVVPALAAEALALLAHGELDAARSLEHELLDDELRLAEHDELVRLARTELAFAAGDEARGKTLLGVAVARMDARAASLQEPVRRNEYLARPPCVVQTLSLARTWLGR